MDPLNNKVIEDAKNNQPVRTKRRFSAANIVLLLLLVSSLGFNQLIMAKTMRAVGLKRGGLEQIIGKPLKPSGNKGGQKQLSGDLMQDVIKLVMSSGVPEVYGQELGVSFDQVQQSMNVLRQFDPTYGKNKITLAGNDFKRYVDIGQKIACEYCCGAKGLVFEDGRAACGCAHSQTMRGLSAYLIQNHGSEYTDDEILRELARWKGMYFPKQMIKKLASQLQGAQFTPDTAALILGEKLPDYGGGSAPLPSEIKNLPSMVGGC